MLAGALIPLLVLGAEARWGLTWKSREGCIQPAELAELIEKRLGRPLFGVNPDVRIDGYVRAAERGAGFMARLTLVGADGTVYGTREVTSTAASCRAIDGSLALVASVMVADLETTAAPALPQPPPPPSSEPAAPPEVQVPPTPPRDEWPGYIRIRDGNFYIEGHWVMRNAFYRAVGRVDLDERYSSRLLGKALTYLSGSVALTAGAVLMLLQPANVGCTRWVGPEYSLSCAESSQWPLYSGLVVAGAGIVAIVVAAIVRAVPTTPDEDADLAEQYNQRLRAPSLPATASR